MEKVSWLPAEAAVRQDAAAGHPVPAPLPPRLPGGPAPALDPHDAGSINVFAPHEGLAGHLAVVAGVRHADVGHRGRDSAA